MKILILLFVPMLFLLNATTFSANIAALPSLDKRLEAKQNTISTRKDFDNFIKDMQKSIITSNYKTAYYIGLAYGKDILLSDGSVIKADNEKALRYFKLAVDAGVNYAAVDGAMLYMSQNRRYPALTLLEKALDSDSAKVDPISSYLSNMYGAYVLDTFTDNKVIVTKAISYIDKYSLSKRSATTEYIYANLLNCIHEYKAANFFLTMACTNPNITNELRDICFKSEIIEVQNAKSNSLSCGSN